MARISDTLTSRAEYPTAHPYCCPACKTFEMMSKTSERGGDRYRLVSNNGLVQYLLGIASIAAGAVKVYLHYHSIWMSQSDPLDYVLGACGVAAGSALVIVTARPSLKQGVGILAPLFVLALTGTKAATDFRDVPDVLICLLIGLAAAILLYFAAARPKGIPLEA